MIAIIAAMEEEVNAICQRMDKVEKHTIRNVKFYEGKLSGKEVVTMQSGVGKVSAAMSTTLLLDHYEVDCVVNIGTAGGLLESQEVLDVVISTKVAHHDVDVSAFNWPRGFDQDKTCYKADEKCVELIKSIIEEKDRVWVGPIASGDSFISTAAQVNEIKKYYPEAMCAEMEAAAVAQVCNLFNKPFVVVRSLSDITLVKDNHLTFNEYVVLASERSALWCDKFVAKYYNKED